MSSFIIVYFSTCVHLVSWIHSLSCILRGNYDTTTWFFPAKMIVLWPSSSPLGWYLKLICYMHGADSYFFAVSAINTYLASCGFYIQACCQHIRLSFAKIDERIASKKQLNREDYIEIESNFKSVITLHIKIME